MRMIMKLIFGGLHDQLLFSYSLCFFIVVACCVYKQWRKRKRFKSIPSRDDNHDAADNEDNEQLNDGSDTDHTQNIHQNRF